MFSLWFYLILNHADFNSLIDFMTFQNQSTNQTNKNRASVGKWTDFEGQPIVFITSDFGEQFSFSYMSYNV